MAVAGLAARLNVLDITPDGVNLIAEIPASRFEPDPMFAWFSLREDTIYVRPDENSSRLVQIDTASKQLVNIDIGRDYDVRNLEELAGMQFSRLTRIIGEPLDRQDNSLMRFFFGDSYREQFNFNEITVTLVDFLTPATQHSGTQTVALLYIFNEARATGRFEFVDFYSASGFSVSPDNQLMAVRRNNNEGRVLVERAAQVQIAAMAATGGRPLVVTDEVAERTYRRQWGGDGTTPEGVDEWPALLRSLDDPAFTNP